MTKTKDTEVSLAVIYTKLDYIQSDVSTIKRELESINKNIDDHAKSITAIEQKTSGMAVFQGVFSVVVAGIASFLGAKR